MIEIMFWPTKNNGNLTVKLCER